MGLRIIAVGGHGVVGRNCTAIEVDGDLFLFDMGLHLENYTRLQDEDENGVHRFSGEQLIREGAAPDISVLDKSKVKAVLVSHAHLDHVGAVPFLSDEFIADVHGTPFTMAVAKKLAEDKSFKLRNSLVSHDYREVFALTDSVSAEFIEVTHSTPQTAAIALHTPYGVVLYLNDFKLDDHPTMGGVTDVARLRELRPYVLIMDSLYADVEGRVGSESVASRLLEEALLSDRLKGRRVLVSSFSSHIARLHELVAIARRMGRKVMFVGRSMAKYLEAAHEVGLSDVIERDEVVRYSSKARKALSKVADPDRYLFVVTGGMGEPNAVLSRIVDEGYLPLRKDDVVVFSNRVIPVPSIIEARERLEGRLRAKGFRLVKDLHVSGHGAREDMRLVLEAVRPRRVVPVHGDASQRDAFRSLAVAAGVPSEGVLVLFDGDVCAL